MLASQAQLSPIFALYAQPKPTINHLLAVAVEGAPPFIEIEQDNGDECRLWRITDPALIEKLQQEMKDQSLLIADGHHRYEATLNYRNHMRNARGQWNGREAFNYILTYFANVHDENVVILPTHRLVRGYAHKPFLELEETLQTYFYVEQHPKTPEGKASFLKALKTAAKKHHVIGASFKRDPRYLILRLKNKRIMQRLAKDLSAPLRELDVSTLHLLILEHILGMHAEQQVSEGQHPLHARRRERAPSFGKRRLPGSFYSQRNQGGRNSRHRLDGRKDAAEIDLFLSQAALRFDRQQDRCGRADRNCGDIIRNQDQFPFFKLEILSPRPPLRPLKTGPFQFIISY